MSKVPSLNFDIVREIIDRVAHSDTLYNCTLVCKDWLPVAQRHLLQTIDLRCHCTTDDERPHICPAVTHLISVVSKPLIGTYILNLSLPIGAVRDPFATPSSTEDAHFVDPSVVADLIRFVPNLRVLRLIVGYPESREHGSHKPLAFSPIDLARLRNRPCSLVSLTLENMGCLQCGHIIADQCLDLWSNVAALEFVRDFPISESKARTPLRRYKIRHLAVDDNNMGIHDTEPGSYSNIVSHVSHSPLETLMYRWALIADNKVIAPFAATLKYLSLTTHIQFRDSAPSDFRLLASCRKLQKVRMSFDVAYDVLQHLPDGVKSVNIQWSPNFFHPRQVPRLEESISAISTYIVHAPALQALDLGVLPGANDSKYSFGMNSSPSFINYTRYWEGRARRDWHPTCFKRGIKFSLLTVDPDPDFDDGFPKTTRMMEYMKNYNEKAAD